MHGNHKQLVVLEHSASQHTKWKYIVQDKSNTKTSAINNTKRVICVQKMFKIVLDSMKSTKLSWKLITD